MNTSRLAILGVIAIVAAIVAATQTCRDRPPAAETATRDTKANPTPTGVSPRAADTPVDLRERDRVREDEPAAPPTAPTAPADAVAQPDPPVDPARQEPSEPPSAPAVPASPTIEGAMAAAKTAAEGEVAKVRTEMRRACGDALDRGGGGSVKLGFSLSFDAEGKVLASAVQQGRETYIDGLDRCLAPFAHAIAVPAPGEPVSVEVDVELP